jgi:cytochrome bd-type quinol oxidase subunit 2
MGIEKHIEVMTQMRKIYRNFFAEILLLSAVSVQVLSGIKLYRSRNQLAKGFYEKLQLWSGLYLAIFFVIHLSAVMVGRFILQLDTNFYFGAAGLNQFPFNVFFIPYYSLAIFSFFAHIASVHYRKMKERSRDATIQSRLIIIVGVVTVFFLIYGLTNRFNGIAIPSEYGILIGK